MNSANHRFLTEVTLLCTSSENHKANQHTMDQRPILIQKGIKSKTFYFLAIRDYRTNRSLELLSIS